MPEYHIGPGLGDRVMAGVLNPERKDGIRLWKYKSDVTSEFWQTVLAILPPGYQINVEDTKNHKTYVVTVTEVDDAPVSGKRWERDVEEAYREGHLDAGTGLVDDHWYESDAYAKVNAAHGELEEE